ncbi:MAG: FAD-dependent oxidoreductase [Phycisphaerales bacterium]|nr:FAD-dependent oxidoreductase [Phycisphaerales bacterium]
MPATIHLDALVLGGGIAGLWTLRTLREREAGAMLLEARAIGGGQTVASQGIIHGGVKYALGGAASRASRLIADMPARWGESLAGSAFPDLSGARVLSDACTLWTGGGVGSRLMGLAASKAIRVKPHRLSGDERPEPFGDAPSGVDVYRLDETVLDPCSLVRALAEPVLDAIFSGGPSGMATDRGTGVSPVRTPRLERTDEGVVCTITNGSGEELRLVPRHLVACAGAGNEQIARDLGLDTEVRMQRRPLHMVLARKPAGEDFPRIFGHCVGAGSKPRLTITSGDSGGRTVWWIGGQIAESGVDRSRDEQIAETLAELRSVLGWVDLDGIELATVRIDRAEGFMPDGSRPDEPVIRSVGRVHICWPTKLAFAPIVADRVSELVGEPEHPQPQLGVEPPPFAPPPWAIDPSSHEEIAWTDARSAGQA